MVSHFFLTHELYDSVYLPQTVDSLTIVVISLVKNRLNACCSCLCLHVYIYYICVYVLVCL